MIYTNNEGKIRKSKNVSFETNIREFLFARYKFGVIKIEAAAGVNRVCYFDIILCKNDTKSNLNLEYFD